MKTCEHLKCGECTFHAKWNSDIPNKAKAKEKVWVNWWSGRSGIDKWNVCTVETNIVEQQSCNKFKATEAT